MRGEGGWGGRGASLRHSQGWRGGVRDNLGPRGFRCVQVIHQKQGVGAWKRSEAEGTAVGVLSSPGKEKKSQMRIGSSVRV